MTPSAGPDQLTDLGLTRYEARAYLALVGRNQFTAAEVSRVSGVPRQRIYDILGSLVSRGMVQESAGHVVRYRALDPTIAVNGLMTAHRAELDRLERSSTRLVDELMPIWLGGRSQSDPLDYVEVIRDPEVLALRFAEIQTGCERQLLTMAKLPYQVTENPAGLAAAERLAHSGGDVRCVYEPQLLAQAHYISMVNEFVAAGERARIARTVPMRLCIADGSRVLLSLRDPVADQTSTTNVLIEHPALAECLGYAFETIWNGAVDFDPALTTADL
jgi:hypothetical protein